MALTSIFADLGLPPWRAILAGAIGLAAVGATSWHVMDARAARLAYGATERASERATWQAAAAAEQERQDRANRAAMEAAAARVTAAEARAAALAAQLEEIDRAASEAPGADLPVFDLDLVRRLRSIK